MKNGSIPPVEAYYPENYEEYSSFPRIFKPVVMVFLHTSLIKLIVYIFWGEHVDFIPIMIVSDTLTTLQALVTALVTRWSIDSPAATSFSNSVGSQTQKKKKNSVIPLLPSVST